MGQCLANSQFYVEQAIGDILRPPPPVDYEQWATENVSFSDSESQFTGPYNPSRFKPFTEIYKALSPADPCRIVTLSKGAQIGGTIIATVFFRRIAEILQSACNNCSHGSGKTCPNRSGRLNRRYYHSRRRLSSVPRMPRGTVCMLTVRENSRLLISGSKVRALVRPPSKSKT